MGYDFEEAKKDVEKLTFLFDEKNRILEQYDFIPNTDNEDELLSFIEEIDESISSASKRDPKEIELSQEKTKQQLEILFEYYEIVSKLHILEKKIIKCISNSNQEQIASTISKSVITTKNYKETIDTLCMSIYNVPLLVALITNDPQDIIKAINSILDLSDYREDVKTTIIQYIENQKLRIEKNLILSDKAIIDLIETTTGKNIINESLESGRIIEQNKKNGYSLIKNNYQDLHRHTYGGDKIIKFQSFDEAGNKSYNRKSSNMFIRDFPDSTSEEIMFKSFSSLSNERKQQYIKTVLENLELCYEMFKSYYLNNDIVIPTHLKLTNGEEMDYHFYRYNLPHILGINQIKDLPERTIKALRLDSLEDNEIGKTKDILEKILERKDEIIKNCGLIKEPLTNTYYELLPWEKIILKTNAFIRGDFFKTPAIIIPINKTSGLFSPQIKRISLTSTQFSKSPLNQPIRTMKEVDMLRAKNQEVDFTVKGMCYDEHSHIWVPQTNASAMGERIIVNNSKRIKTLERYRKALEDYTPETIGGLISSVENEKSIDPKEYSVEELAQVLVDIALTFGDSKKISERTVELFEQLKEHKKKRK